MRGIGTMTVTVPVIQMDKVSGERQTQCTRNVWERKEK